MKGYFWGSSCHILLTSYFKKWTKHTYAAQVMMSVLWQREMKNCATKYKTSYRLLTVGSKLPLQLCLALFLVYEVLMGNFGNVYHLKHESVWFRCGVYILINARWSFSLQFCAYIYEVILLPVWSIKLDSSEPGHVEPNQRLQQ